MASVHQHSSRLLARLRASVEPLMAPGVKDTTQDSGLYRAKVPVMALGSSLCLYLDVSMAPKGGTGHTD